MICRRTMLIARQNTDLHMFNMIAARNRVHPHISLLNLPANPPKSRSEINMHDYLPDSNFEKLLVDELEILVTRDVIKYVQEVKGWTDDLLPKIIKHDHMDAISKISEVHSLGIVNKSEQTTEGIIDIMEEQHKFLPILCNGLVRLLTAGDLVTVEREINTQIDKEDSFTSSQRLEGLIPILADVHTYG
ncbi:uncharacterized protein, partial [Clytia hemisphaerica]|uniref:uncharacterized protein n=1 Tax=Clytia hemisphaerica TaxID=252671 RepID=UPI0034D690F0